MQYCAHVLIHSHFNSL